MKRLPTAVPAPGEAAWLQVLITGFSSGQSLIRAAPNLSIGSRCRYAMNAMAMTAIATDAGMTTG